MKIFSFCQFAELSPSSRRVLVPLALLAILVLLQVERGRHLERSPHYVEIEASQRDYTTEKSIQLAPFHRGRIDEVVRLYGFYRVEIKEDLNLTIYGQWRSRSTSSAFRTSDLGIEKDYDQYETGVRLSYRFGA